MLQADPTLRPSDIKARLMTSATHDDRLPFETGAGYLDVAAALDATLRTPTANSPRAVPDPNGDLVIEPIGDPWDGGWQLGLIWGGGRSFGTMMATENGMVTAGGLIWGGSRNSLGADSLVWGGSRNSLGADSLVWGGSRSVSADSLVWGGSRQSGGVDALVSLGEPSLIGTDGSNLACTGLLWGGH
jgi:hypothetical protein